MKLIYCNDCQDIIRLHKTTGSCLCGDSGGHYKADGTNAVIYGNCQPLGFTNSSFMNARIQQPEHGAGYKFTAFVIPKVCPTVEHVDSEEYESLGGEWSSIDEELMDKADKDIMKDLNLKNKIKNVFKDEE